MPIPRLADLVVAPLVCWKHRQLVGKHSLEGGCFEDFVNTLFLCLFICGQYTVL